MAEILKLCEEIIEKRFKEDPKDEWGWQKFEQILELVGGVSEDMYPIVSYVIKAEAKIEKRKGCYCRSCCIRIVEQANWALGQLLGESMKEAEKTYQDFHYEVVGSGLKCKVIYGWDYDKHRYDQYWKSKKSSSSFGL